MDPSANPMARIACTTLTANQRAAIPQNSNAKHSALENLTQALQIASRTRQTIHHNLIIVQL
jgi:hypothetical protein